MKLSYNEATSMGCPDSSLENDVLGCAKAGFELIELRFDKLYPYLETHSINELAELFQQNGVKPLTFNAVYLYQQLFTDEDVPERKLEVVKAIELAAELSPVIGAKDIIVVVPLYREETAGPYVGDWETVKQDCIRILRHLSDFADKHGLRLGLETVGNFRSGVRTLEKAAEIVEAVNKSNVGYVLDAYNIFQYDKSNDFSPITKLPQDKIFAVHINNADDADLSMISQSDRRFCDTGVINLDAYMSAIQSTGYDGMISIETVRPEYWQQSSDSLIKEAYLTTEKAIRSYL